MPLMRTPLPIRLSVRLSTVDSQREAGKKQTFIRVPWVGLLLRTVLGNRVTGARGGALGNPAGSGDGDNGLGSSNGDHLVCPAPN